MQLGKLYSKANNINDPGRASAFFFILEQMSSLLIILLLFLNNICLAQSIEQKDSNIISIGKVCITRIIAADDSLGAIRNHACETGTLSKSIKNYVRSIKKLNFNNCPPGFKKSFSKHTKAWIGILKITDKYPSLRGEMHELFDQLEKGDNAVEFKKHQQHIWDTWTELEKFIKPVK